MIFALLTLLTYLKQGFQLCCYYVNQIIKFKEEVASKSGVSKVCKFEELSDAKIRGLYDESVVFQFYDLVDISLY